MRKRSLPKQTKERIWELDFLRAVCVMLMIFDHTMYNFAFVFGRTWFEASGSEFYYNLWQNARTYWTSPIREFVQPLVVIIFCSLCGISTAFSKSNLKRGIEVAVCAALVTIVTTIMDSPITFGILHMFAVAILLWTLIDFICRHDKKKTAFACLGIGFFIVFTNMLLMPMYEANNQLFADNNDWAWVGEFLYGNPYESFSADYQPIFPLVGYMLIGASASHVLYPNKKSLLPWLGKYDWYKPINFWGKIALPVYVLHQVVITVILALISFFFITKGDFVVI